MSINNYLRVLPLPGYRGNILDRYGREMAGNKLSFKLQVLPDKLSEREKVFETIAGDFGLDSQEVKSRFKKRLVAPFAPVTLIENIPLKKAIIFKEKYRSLPGVMVVEEIKRVYAGGSFASHLLGYLGEISRQELAHLKPYGYRYSSLIGKGGIEKELEPYLKGEDGGMLVKVDNKGRVMEILGKEEPRRGLDIYLSIDSALQKKAEEILFPEKGCLLVMDVRSGEILVLANSPGFDPNLFLKPERKKISSLLSSKSQPLFNRAIQGEYPLGSIFKLVVAIAGLESGRLKPTTRFFCPGYYELGGRKYRCWKEEGHGWQNLREAIMHSCNSYFYQAGLKVGIDEIINYARLLGFGEATGIDLPYENDGLLPSPNWKRKKLKQPWYPGDTVNLAVGQGYLLVTPIQVLRFISALANGGYLITPFVTKSISGEEASSPEFNRLPLKPWVLNFIRSAMKAVVNHPTATGQLAKMKEVSIAGKTATAEAPRGAPHAWFVGFAPSEEPEIAFLVLVEHGGGGGYISARMAKEFLEYYFERKTKGEGKN